MIVNNENSSTDLQIGDSIEIVYVSASNEEIVLKSNVYSVHSDKKYSIGMPLYKSMLFPINVGNRLSLHYYKKDLGIYSFKCLVVSRAMEDNLPAFQVLRISDIEKSQRRMFYRVNFFSDITIKIAKNTSPTEEEKRKIELIKKKYASKKDIIVEDEEDDFELLNVEGRDLSGGGFRFVSRKRFQVGDVIQGYINIENTKLEYKARIVRVDLNTVPYEYYEAGCMFEELEEAVRTRIINYIFKRQKSALVK